MSVLNKSPAVSDSGRDPKLIENDLKDDNFDTYSPFDDYYYYDNDQLDQVVIHDPVSESAVQDNVDIISDLPPDIYCDLVETLNDKCLESSILEIWKFNEDVIAKLSTQDILAAVNAINKSPHYGYNFNYSTLLGKLHETIANRPQILIYESFYRLVRLFWLWDLAWKSSMLLYKICSIDQIFFMTFHFQVSKIRFCGHFEPF